MSIEILNSKFYIKILSFLKNFKNFKNHNYFLKGVGGTTLNWNGNAITSITDWMNETAWSCTTPKACNTHGGSNGGYSTYFKRPSYQKGIQSNLYRGVPDLSSNAYPHSGYDTCFTGQNATIDGYFCKKWGGVGFFKLFFQRKFSI